jgi:hypothetical protein
VPFISVSVDVMKLFWKFGQLETYNKGRDGNKVRDIQTVARRLG